MINFISKCIYNYLCKIFEFHGKGEFLFILLVSIVPYKHETGDQWNIIRLCCLIWVSADFYLHSKSV